MGNSGDRPCSVDGCSVTKITAKGMCKTHYERVRVHGTASLSEIRRVAAERRASKRPDGKLWCSRCHQFLDDSAFRPRRGGRPEGQTQCWCAACQASYGREYRMAKSYGLTIQQVEEIFEAQNGACKLCLRELTLGGKESTSAKVDHDHVTGVVRGLLCDLCNRGLGYFKDRPEVMERAARYVREEGRV